MKLAEVRKAVVAGAALIATAAPQLLVFGDLLPPSVALGMMIVAILAGIVGVWAVPNKPLTSRVADTIDSIQDLAPIIRDMARKEVAAAATPVRAQAVIESSPPVESKVRPANPFAIPPIGR
ncbi:hypothetical protein ACWDTG_06665 [Rhodococcus zopfii]